jgi:phosphatidylserine synthase
MEAAHFTFMPTLALLTVTFYLLGALGWAILFALRRSGIHRLADLSGQPR